MVTDLIRIRVSVTDISVRCPLRKFVLHLSKTDICSQYAFHNYNGIDKMEYMCTVHLTLIKALIVYTLI